MFIVNSIANVTQDIHSIIIFAIIIINVLLFSLVLSNLLRITNLGSGFATAERFKKNSTR